MLSFTFSLHFQERIINLGDWSNYKLVWRQDKMSFPCHKMGLNKTELAVLLRKFRALLAVGEALHADTYKKPLEMLITRTQGKLTARKEKKTKKLKNNQQNAGRERVRVSSLMSPSDICGDLFRLGSAGLGEINNLGAFHEYQSMLNAQYDYREVVCGHRPSSVIIITECLKG